MRGHFLTLFFWEKILRNAHSLALLAAGAIRQVAKVDTSLPVGRRNDKLVR
jgi:hypothetical protein